MMYFLIFTIILFLGILLWWFEATYNYFHDLWKGIKEVCPWIEKQTKLKLGICKLIAFSLCMTFMIFIWSNLYSPYLGNFVEYKNGAVQLKEVKTTLEPVSDNNESIPLIKVEVVNDASEIGDWGTFGDFIGGTLNPIIGFISILLLFATWKLTRKTLDFTKQELRNSNDLLITQQFDAIFWGLFNNLKKIEEILYTIGDYEQIKINEIYYDVFRCNFNEPTSNHSRRREKILKNAEISQYFICLYQIFKNIDERIFLDNKEDEKKIKKAYSNILRASIPTKLLQLLAVNCHEEFKEYKEFLEDYNFLEHMPFYIIDHEKYLNLGLLECLTTFDEKIFDESIYYEEFQKKEYLNIFFDKKIQSYKDYIKNYLMKDFGGEQFVENNSLDLKIFLDWDQDNFQLVWWGSYQGQEMQREPCKWYISMNGIEIQIGGLNYHLLINSYSEQLIEFRKNPL